MKKPQFTPMLLFIVASIVVTIALQVYWNIKNYQETKERIINEVQIALDLSVEQYYATISKQNIVTYKYLRESTKNKSKVDVNLKNDTVVMKWANNLKPKPVVQSQTKPSIKLIRKQYGALSFKVSNNNKLNNITVSKSSKLTDSTGNLKKFTDRIIISMQRDSVDFKLLSRFLQSELNRKNIIINYNLDHIKNNRIYQRFEESKNLILPLETFSKSTYLPDNEKLKLNFSDPNRLILKRISWTIILSIIFSGFIVSCLMYLLRIINNQKKIDVMKNDLISNITHEFKTPITTISSAIEGIRVFNQQNDAEKTTRYLDISQQQLLKLETMVEKILETASLQTNQLQLAKTSVDINQLCHNIVQRFETANPTKTFVYHNSATNIKAEVDSFHFENAITNLIENAAKHGGNKIFIDISSEAKDLEIIISDNGEKIEKAHQHRIFEQFYRIPTGNVHNVKGFGIGLYYAKQIIEKHGGTLIFVPNQLLTTFKITLPNE